MAAMIPSISSLHNPIQGKMKLKKKRRFLIIKEGNVLRSTPLSLARNELQEKVRADILKKALGWL